MVSASKHVSAGSGSALIVLGIVILTAAACMLGFAAAARRGDQRWHGMKVWRDSASDSPRAQRIGIVSAFFISAVAAVGGVTSVIAGVTRLGHG